VEIILSKGVNSEIWWPVVQLGHPEIDVKAIDGAKYLDDSILKKIYEQVRFFCVKLINVSDINMANF
jgi:hypothetical protein